jgi:hypothetical protein
MLPKLNDYWDELVGAIDGFGLELLELGNAERSAAAGEIAASVREHVRVMPDEFLMRATVPMLDDLYKAVCAATRWDVGLSTYLEASARTFMSALAERGFRCQYLVDNGWADLTKPLELLPHWYRCSGIVYACPQLVARDEMMRGGSEAVDGTQQADILRSDSSPGGILAEMPAFIELARDVVDGIVGMCADEGRHLFQLDADLADRSFARAFEHAGASGVLTVFRNVAPEADSTVQAWLPPGFSWT